MIESEQFKKWLKDETSYSDKVVRDVTSRAKRADNIREWDGTETYIFYLEQEIEFQKLSVSVKSQMRRAISLYKEYYNRISALQNKDNIGA